MKKVLTLGIASLIVAGGMLITTSRAFAEYEDGNSFGNRIKHGINAVADFLGMSTEELRNARTEGKTTEDILNEQGKTREDLQNYMKEQAMERWQEMGLSDEEIQQRLQRMEERHANWNGEYPNGGRGGFGGKGGFGRRGECIRQ